MTALAALDVWVERRELERNRALARINEADMRVAAWARWQRSSGVYLGFPPESPFVRVMKPQEAEEQAGARHVSVDAPDDEAMQVDRILAGWRIWNRRRYRIVRTEFFVYGPASVKAARFGLGRKAWKARVEQTLELMADELGLN